jgi:hypothetical protein
MDIEHWFSFVIACRHIAIQAVLFEGRSGSRLRSSGPPMGPALPEAHLPSKQKHGLTPLRETVPIL